MTLDLDALEKLADEATPGPWTTRTLENFGWNVVHYRNRDRFNIERVSKCSHEENAAYIAAANPATIKALIAELREARATIVTIDEFCRDSIHSTEMLMSNPPQNIVAYAVGKLVRAFLARNGADT